MEPIKVLVVDEDILVRRAITNILDLNEEFEVCWLADGGEQIESVLHEKYPDVVLLSIDSMESPGLTILSKLRINFPNLPVIAVSPRNEEGAEAAINALRLGAVDFISKPAHKKH
ncbi:MAG: response regulator [Fodinibius sp.]|nr:response regulator [Fodinibius sp.]